MVLLMPRGVSLRGMNEDFKLKVPDELQGKMHADRGSD